MNPHPKIKIASFDGSTVKARTPDTARGPVPSSLDKILDELAMSAVEGISDRPARDVRYPGRRA